MTLLKRVLICIFIGFNFHRKLKMYNFSIKIKIDKNKTNVYVKAFTITIKCFFFQKPKVICGLKVKRYYIISFLIKLFFNDHIKIYNIYIFS